MRIGVFGDSFANKYWTNTWWGYLRDFGHDVTSFGECGSSLTFSAGLLWTHAYQFDYLVWCATTVNRVSFWHDEKSYHVTNSFDGDDSNVDVQRLQDTARRYLSDIIDMHGSEVVGHLAIHGALANYPNLLVIPCFATPVYFMKPVGFNLFDLSSREAQYYFPGQSLYEIHTKFFDNRPGHLTSDWQQVLATKVNQAIDSGQRIFCGSYDDFSNPTESLERVFSPR